MSAHEFYSVYVISASFYVFRLKNMHFIEMAYDIPKAN